jgi:hypothetical protein
MIDFHSLTHAPIGAYACIEFKDDNSIVDGYYISFGTYADDTQEDAEIFDTYGVPDTRIFYYAPQGEAELIELMSDNCYNDFKILSYELEYK